MPAISIKSFLEKMELRKHKDKSGIIEIRGPNGYVMLIRYTTDHIKEFQIQINIKLKKCWYE